MKSQAATASHYGNRRHRPAPVEYGWNTNGDLVFGYRDGSSLIVSGYGDLSEWLWNFRAENAPRAEVVG